VKRIVPGTVDVLAEGERPEVLHADKDFRVDEAAGLFIPLPGGRCEPGGQVSLRCHHVRTPPLRQELPTGVAWTLDGDDAIAVPNGPTAPGLATLTIRLVVTPTAALSPEAVLIGRGPGFALRLVQGRLAIEHRGMRDAHAAGEPAPVSTTTQLLAPGVRQELLLRWDRGTLALFVNDQSVLSRTGLVGALAGGGAWRLSGARDPSFYQGQIELRTLEGAP